MNPLSTVQIENKDIANFFLYQQLACKLENYHMKDVNHHYHHQHYVYLFCCFITFFSYKSSSRDLGRITYPTMPAWKRTNSGGSLLDTCVRFHVSGSFYVAKVSRAFSTNLKKNITHDKFY